MSEDTSKIEQKVEKTEPEVTANELPEHELDKASGGAATSGFLKATSRIADTTT